MPSAVAANPGHLAYFYCFDEQDADSICAFQLYESAAASQAFLQDPRYRAYLQEVEPLLAGPPQVTTLAPQWSKTLGDVATLNGGSAQTDS